MTVEAFIGEFNLRFPEVSLAVGLKYLNKGLRSLAFRTPLRRVDVAIPAVANQAEYDLAATVDRIEQVIWETSATNTSGWTKLSETSIEELNLLSPSWRMQASGTPTQWYRSTAATGDSAKTVIGLYPTPSTASSPTYPRLRVYGAGSVELDAADTVPTNLLYNDVLLDVMSYYYAKDRKRDEIGIWLPLAEKALGEGVQFIKEGSSEGTTDLLNTGLNQTRGR